MSDWSDQANYGRGGFLPDMGSGGPSAFSRPYGGYSFEQGLPYSSGAATLPMSAAPRYPVTQQSYNSQPDFYGPRFDPWKAYEGSWGPPNETDVLGPRAPAHGMTSTELSNIDGKYKKLQRMGPGVYSPGYSNYGYQPAPDEEYVGRGGGDSPYNQTGDWGTAGSNKPPQQLQASQEPQRNWAEEYKKMDDTSHYIGKWNPVNPNPYGDPNHPANEGRTLEEIKANEELIKANQARQGKNYIRAPLKATREALSDTVGSASSGMMQAGKRAGNFPSQLFHFQHDRPMAPGSINPDFSQATTQGDYFGPYFGYPIPERRAL